MYRRMSSERAQKGDRARDMDEPINAPQPAEDHSASPSGDYAGVALPLAVDLDGTLTHTDTLHEGCLAFLKAQPRELLGAFGHLRAGKAAFKDVIASGVDFDPDLIPYNTAFLSWLRTQKAQGRRIGLFTAADQSIADAVARHLKLFDVAVGSSDGVNLSGEAKLAAIRARLGARFAYAGDAVVDRPIFNAAEKAVLVGDVERLRREIAPGVEVEEAFPRKTPGLGTWARALRLQHWAKNLLIFIAPALSPLPLALPRVVETLVLFLAMGLLASATYVVNDLLDLSADRQHPRKRARPFAAGEITPGAGVAVAGLLLAAAVTLALALPPAAGACLGLYAAITLAYSFALKRQPIVDVFVLAGLFTVRVLAGSMLFPHSMSPWLLTFSMFFFLGLAMVKRHAELERVIRAGGAGVVSRGYTARDIPLLLAAGIASSFSAIVIFMIYLINEQYPNGLYARPALLWAMMPIILIWVLRVWHLTVHGRMNEDPVIFALKDRFSLVLGIIAVFFLWLAR